MAELPENAVQLEKMPPRRPTNGTFELTVRCNLHCKMCLFRHDDAENAEIMKKELTAAQWIDMARQAAEIGTFNLLITGGEPLLRPDFCEIWEGIYQYGFLITLYTNATLVTPKIMETLRKYPPHKIGVTIYGASPETYEKVCGNADAFERMLDGVRQLKTLPSVMEYRMTVIKDNYPDVEAIEDLVKREFDPEAAVVCSATITHAVRGACADVNACRLDPEIEHRMHLDRKLKIIREFVGDQFDINKVSTKDSDKSRVDNKRAPLLGCPAGMSSYVITWNGQMLACQMLGVFHADALLLGIHKAWEVLPDLIVLPPPNPKCASCDAAESCQSCYATRYAETGSLSGCSEYLYRDAYTRKIFENQYRRK